MAIVSKDAGWIEVICGPMFSGKTEELIRRLRNAQAAGNRTAAVKPSMDDRYPGNAIVSHSNLRMPCVTVDSAAEINFHIDAQTQVIGIDEANLFGPDLAPAIAKFADAGKRVIVAGLDTDYRGRPFPPMPEIIALAKFTTNTLAVCNVCGAPARYSQRLIRSEELILVGAVDSYEARCRRCFRPVLPEQQLPVLLASDPKTSALN